MYLVVQIYTKGPELGVMYHKDSWEEAVNLAVYMAKEQCDTPEKEIREEIESDADFRDPAGEWAVSIGQPKFK